jgi:DNA-binding CsgD family transcriptional regulator
MQFVLANSFDKATIRSGNYKEARHSLEDRVTKSLQSGFGDSMIGALDLLVEVCLLDNDSSAAQKWAEEAEALARVSHSILRNIVALLCRAEAFESVEAALQAIEIGKQHDLMLYLGRAHLLAGRFGDEPQVHLHAAFQIFEQLEAVPLKQKTAQHMRSRGIAAPRKIIESDSGLTESETSIAGLVAQGFSNKEIANALHYSIKTVEVYLTRIYQKTNCRSRLDLARAISNGEVILKN